MRRNYLIPKKLEHLILSLIMLFSISLSGQITIQGNISSSEDGLGLIGANVQIKNTSIGTITDFDSHFNIEANSKDDILIISYIGYHTQEFRIGDQTVFEIQLKTDAFLIDDIVVLGYSEKSKTEISGAVTSLSADDINKVTVNSVEDMLIGKVAGVHIQSAGGQPGNAAQIRIRGVGSVFSPQAPLIVVDGIIGGSYNPNDIASVSVLKDAAATGLYGSQAAAGVIVITTKIGVSEKPQVQASVLRGIKQATVGNFQLMSGEELYNYHKLVYDPQVFGSVRPSVLRTRDFNWIDESFSEAQVQRYSLSINAKKEKFNYYISADYFDDEGTALNSEYKRATLNTKIAYQMTDRFKLTTRVFTQTYWAKYPHYTYTESPFRSVPWDQPFDEKDRPTLDIRDWYSNVPSNIFHSNQFNDYGGKGTSFEGNLWLDYKINDWLKLRSQNSASAGFNKSNSVQSALSIEGAPTQGVIGSVVSFSNSYGTTNLLFADKSFGQHAISALAGMEGGVFVEEFDIGGNGFGIFPGQEILSAAGTTTSSGNKRESKSFSILSQLNYNFAHKYFITASFRRDGSSKFGPSNRYANFYTAAASWLISNEDFFKGIKDKVNYLKVRASYGAIGNETFPDNTFYPYFPSYSFLYSYNNESAAFPTNVGNPSLSWESSYPANFGIDLGLFNRLELNIDVYNTTTKDLLFQDPSAYSLGFQFQWKNIGEINNKGIELNLNTDVIKTKNLNWNLNINLGSNSNEMIKLSDKGIEQIEISTNDIFQVFRVGDAPFSWYMPRWMGVDPANGDPQWETITYDDNGNETSRGVTNSYPAATFQNVGNPFPKLTGGLSSNLSWKAFTLQASLSFVYGNDIYFATRKEIDNDGANNNVNAIKLTDDESRWQQPGDIATHPKPRLGGNKNGHEHSSRYLEDGSYLRLRNVSLSYDLPESLISKIGLEQFRLRISGDNLLTWTKFSGMDPDVPLYSNSFSLPGLSIFKYPISKQVLVGIEIRF